MNGDNFQTPFLPPAKKINKTEYGTVGPARLMAFIFNTQSKL